MPSFESVSLGAHALDAGVGHPARDLALVVAAIDGRAPAVRRTTDARGRAADLLAPGAAPGRYRLAVDVAAYRDARGERGLHPRIVVDLELAAGHHHVVVVLSPHGCFAACMPG